MSKIKRNHSWSSDEFYIKMKKHGEEAKLNKSPEKKKMDELKSELKTARHHWTEQNKKLKEAQQQIKYLKGEVKNLKADNINLKEDIKRLSNRN